MQKINQKNTWQLNLIDHMSDVAEQGHNGELYNFNIASAAIDACAKIYSIRVDSVHVDAYKVLGGLSRTELKEAEQDEENQGEGEAGERDDADKPKRKKAAHVGGIETLVQNLDSINVKKFDLEFTVDPLFTKTSEAFDEGGPKGLLMNHLNVLNGCNLIFDSSDAAVTAAGEQSHESNETTFKIAPSLQASLVGLEKLHICPSFLGWHDWAAPSARAESRNESRIEQAPEANAYSSGGEEPMPYDDGPESYGEPEEFGIAAQQAALDAADQERDAPSDQLNEPLNAKLQPEYVGGDEMAAVVRQFNKQLKENWSGPDHWKFQKKARPEIAKPKGAGAGADEGEEKQKKGRKTKDFTIDFNTPLDDAAIKSMFAPPGRGGTTIRKTGDVSTTLPVDLHYDPEQLTRLFQKPNWRVSNQKKALENAGMQMTSTQAQREELSYHDDALGDLGDAEDIGGDIGEIGDVGDAHEIPATEPGEIASARERSGPLNYARRAKRVDVRLLKEQIWDDLCMDGKPQKKAKAKAPKRDMDKDTTFTQVLRDLPKFASTNDLQDVSVQYCFICLLHLANENNLKISGTDGMNELFIAPSQPLA
jgi:condensin complex subunit 2